ncbi:PRP40 [Sanghuangporus sanghuang]
MSGIWTEHRNAQGHTYWFNTATKESVWEKPEALKTPFERALAQTNWKEYFSGGRKYYYNTETKESKWDMPDELLLVLEKVEKENKPAPPTANPRLTAPNFTTGSQGALVPSGGRDPSLHQNQQLLNGAPNGLAVGAPGGNALPFSPAAGVLPGRPSLPDDPVIPHNGFATLEEGEKAFTHLLKKAGVNAEWTWDQTMRAIITDPLYKALNTLAEKKACWQKYVDGLKEKEREERDARLAKLRPAIRNMLKGNPNVFHYSTFENADRLFAQHPIWQQAKIESERRMIFEEYVGELKERELQEQRAVRSRSVAKVVSLFKELNIDVLTRWRAAHAALLDSEAWANDPELQRFPTLDILLAFEDYARVQEREFEDRVRRETVEKTRRERKAREGYKALLRELVDAGRIKARSKWKNVYPEFQEDERYLNLLGKPGSNPLELFWDVVDRLDQELDAKVAIVEDAIRKANDESGEVFEMKPETAEKDFLSIVMKARQFHEKLQDISDDELKEIFEFLRSEAIKRQETERRRAERKQRHMQDDLRYALKKLPEPIDINMSYDDAVSLMQDLPEYKALEEEGRRTAFAKFMKRQKERMREREREMSEDGGSTTSRRRKEPVGRDGKESERDRDRERERDREKEDSRSSKHHRRSHGVDYEGRRDKEYRDRDRDREREYRDKDKEYRDRDRDRERERDRGRDRDGYKSRNDRGRDKSERDRERDDRVDRRRSSVPAPSPEDPRYPVVHEGSGEKRDRGRSVFSDRSEKRARYDSLEPPRGAPPPREDTPEEGEI